jgi:hypothetical protein
LRQLAKEFNESTNSIRVELNKLSEARILSARREGRQKLFRANTDHPLFEDIRSIVLKSTGINLVVSNIIDNIGNLNMAFVRGDYAVGIDSGLIDLVLVGESLNKPEIERVRLKTEALIKRKISILVLSDTEYKSLENNFNQLPKLMLFQ